MAEERRLVTVLFADVVGSTALGEQLDAEDMRAMLGGYYAIAKEVVTAFGGTLEKFIGDAVMGVFGLPHAHGDDADRALAASLELRDRVRSESPLSELKLRFGVCSGEVVTTREPGTDFLVTGDAVNVAARLQQAAGQWGILAAERTLDAASGSYELGPRIEVEAKGKSTAIAAREVLAMLQQARRARAPRGPMRGRENELDQLALAGRRAFHDQRPAFVTIVAPAGTGKTRLLEEFLSRELPTIAPGAVVAIAQCLPYGNQLTYWPLRQVLFRLVGVSEDEGAEAIRRHTSDWLGNPSHAALMATSIGYGLGDAPDRADVFAAWRAAFEKAARVQPLVIVFEDLHWSSESLLDLVEFVVQAHGNAPILMAALSRPELLDRRPGWGGGKRNFTSLFLEPLADDDMRALVRDLLGEARDGALDAVVSRAGGNPFYAEELVRSLKERGEVEALPDTVQASIQARLDLLPDGERRVLQLGSIFGRTFRVSGVVALAPELATDVSQLTESLLQHDLIRQDDPEHLSFAHILIRDVTYLGMTRSERARLHSAAANWFASRSAGREAAVAELVAFHYREAVSLMGRQRVAGFDEAEVKQRAVRWLARAGDAAGAAGANLEAARHFRAAIEFAGADQLPVLYERLGDVEQLSTRSIDAYSRSLELGRLAGRPAADELRVLGGLLMCGMRWAEGVGRLSVPQVEEMLAEGNRLSDQVDDPIARAKFLAAASFYPFHIEREGRAIDPKLLPEAEARARQSAALAEQAGDWNTWSAALDGLGGILVLVHDWQGSLEVERLRVERESQLSVLERMDAYHMVISDSHNLGLPRQAERFSRDALHLLDYAQNPSLILGLVGDHVRALLHLGDWDKITELGDYAIRVWNESREAIGPGRMAFWAALEVARGRRDRNRAAQHSEVLLQMAHLPVGPWLTAFADGDLARLEHQLETDLVRGYARVDVVERALSVLNDARHQVRASTLEVIDRYADVWKLPLAKAEVLRTRGDYEGAATIWAASGSVLFEARVRIEQAARDGETANEKWILVLKEAGDIEFLESRQIAI